LPSARVNVIGAPANSRIVSSVGVEQLENPLRHAKKGTDKLCVEPLIVASKMAIPFCEATVAHEVEQLPPSVNCTKLMGTTNEPPKAMLVLPVDPVSERTSKLVPTVPSFRIEF